MSSLEIKKINIVSTLKIVPLALLVIFIITGAFFFFVYPSLMGGKSEISPDILKVYAISILSNTIILSLGTVIFELLYNAFAKIFGGAIIETENK